MLFRLGESHQRKSTTDEVREHKTSLQNLNVTPAPKPTTNHVVPAPLVANHSAAHATPRLSAHQSQTLTPVAVAPAPAHTSAPIPQPVQPVTVAYGHVPAHPQKQTTFAPSTVPPQPAPRKLSQPNGQVSFLR